MMIRLFIVASIAFVLLTVTGTAQVPEQTFDTHALEHPEHPTCLTGVWMQLRANEEHLDEKGRAFLSSIEAVQARPVMSNSIISEDGHFRIHYDVTGIHAVSPTDQNGNSIPDYIDSVAYYMEYAWKVEIEEYGFIAPPADNTKPGHGGPDEKIDVYIRDLDSRYYGLAWPDNPLNIVGENPRRVHGYLELDNDYAGYPTPGIEGLRVTSAHEFHHLIQFASYRYDFSQASLYESTSTWFEYRVHPELNDFRFYVNTLLETPNDYGYSTNNVSDQITGYAHMWYLESIARQTDSNIVRKIWEQFRTRESFDAIDAALRNSGQDINLENSYATFARWCYYTGYRNQGEAYFKDAITFPAMSTSATRTMSGMGDVTFEDALYPLSFGLYRLLLGSGSNADTVDFIVTNARSDIGAGGRQLQKEPFTLEISSSRLSGYIPVDLGSDTIYYKVSAPHSSYFAEAIFGGEINKTIAVNTSPQPFINDGANRLVFAVGSIDEEVKDVRLKIFSTNTIPTLESEIHQTSLEIVNNLVGVAWDGQFANGRPAPSGVYLYLLKINDKEPILGKFAVIRK